MTIPFGPESLPIMQIFAELDCDAIADDMHPLTLKTVCLFQHLLVNIITHSNRVTAIDIAFF